MQVNNLTIDQLKVLIRETVRETIEELLTDPETNQTIKEITNNYLSFLHRTNTTQGWNKKPPCLGKEDTFYLPHYLSPSTQKGYPATIHSNEPNIGLPTTIQRF